MKSAIIDRQGLDTGALAESQTETRTPLDSRSLRPAWPPTENVIKAINNLSRDNFLYADYDDSELQKALAMFCHIDAEYIQTYAGSDVALDAICRAYLEPGVEMPISSPTAGSIKYYADIFGVKITSFYGASPFETDIDALIEKINEYTRLIYIGNPSDPAGSILSEFDACRLLDKAQNAMVIIDESALMLRQYSLAYLSKRHNNLFVVRSFDGIYGLDSQPFGFLISHPGNLKFLDKFRLGHSPNIMTNITARAALSDIDLIDRRIENVLENMTYLTVRLRSLGLLCRTNINGNVLIKVDDADRIIRRLKEKQIFADSLNKFAQLENYIMVAIHSDMQAADLVDVLSEIIGTDEMTEPKTMPGITLKRSITIHSGRMRSD